MGGVTEFLGVFFLTLLAAIMLIILAVVFFGITLWVIGVGSVMVFDPATNPLSADYAVLSAAILSFGAILAGALNR